MSETTATRMRRGTLLILAAAWLGAAALLWRTSVPDSLPRGDVDLHGFFTDAELRRSARHVAFLRASFLVEVVLQLAALALLVRRPPRSSAPLAGAAVAVALWLAAAPVAVAVHWWEHRYGIAVRGWSAWTVAFAPSVLEYAFAGAIVGALTVGLARRLGPDWWLGAAAVASAGVAVFLFVSPLLGGGHPLRRRVPGLQGVHVEVERASKRTRAANAEAVGIGPTERIVLWDTILRLPPREVAFVAAHERAHLERNHVAKGFGWAVLLLVPGFWLVARAVRPDRAEVLPRAVLAAGAVALLSVPLANAISRRYEREADWIALQRTRDPAGGQALFRDLALASVAQPDPPRWAYVLFATHPSTRQRLELAASDRSSRGGLGSP
jgi:STE24 endopeptidase